ncbi:MAG TPA: hypothetical protein VGK73_11465 [Polyangiaceae bacterium]
MRNWLFPIALVFAASLLSYWLLGCGVLTSVKRPTPGGIVVVYDPDDGDYRLPSAKARELDERWAALLECLPPEALKRRDAPQVRIRGGNCDSYIDYYGVRVRGEYVPGRVIVPGSLGALAHEFTHHLTGEDHAGPYRDKWLSKCGDEVDRHFRKVNPPRLCPTDPGFKAP